MGSGAAISSITRVLEKHAQELLAEEEISSPGTVLTYRGASIEGGICGATVIHELVDAGGTPYFVTGRTYDIDELAEPFPDCEVAY